MADGTVPAHMLPTALSDKFEKRLNDIEGIVVENDRTRKLVQDLQLFMDTSRGGGVSKCASLIAPTRGGKTTIVKEFLALHEESRDGPADIRPVAYVIVPPNATTVTLGRAAARVMKDVDPDRGDGDALMTRFVHHVRAQQTKLVIFDEMHNLVEKDRGKVARRVADWVQGLIERLEGAAGVLLVGTSRSQRLFVHNGHLVGRSTNHFRVRPYSRGYLDGTDEGAAANADAKADYLEYRAYLTRFDQALTAHGFELSGLSKAAMAPRIHAASRGYPGATAKLVKTAAWFAMVEGDRKVLDMECFAQAFTGIWAISEAYRANPFLLKAAPTDEQVWLGDWEDLID